MTEEDDAFGDEPVAPLPGTGEAVAVAVASGTYFGSVDEWFRRYWRYTYRRQVSPRGTGTGRWAANWWDHDEARQRLDALWRGWEATRRDPGLGISTWWVQHADPHMRALLAPDGCFATTSSENLPGDPLPYAQPPAGLFPPDRTTDLEAP